VWMSAAGGWSGVIYAFYLLCYTLEELSSYFNDIHVYCASFSSTFSTLQRINKLLLVQVHLTRLTCSLCFCFSDIQ